MTKLESTQSALPVWSRDHVLSNHCNRSARNNKLTFTLVYRSARLARVKVSIIFFNIFAATPHIFVSFWCRQKMSQEPRKTVSKIVTLNNGNGQLLLGNLSSVSRKYCESFFMFNLSFFMKCYFVLLRTTDSRNGATSCTCPRGQGNLFNFSALTYCSTNQPSKRTSPAENVLK